MKLSQNFWLSEFTKSNTATRYEIDNRPDQNAIDNLQELVTNVLQPIRTHFDRPVHINSGFRSLKLNRLLRSKDTSQHIKGEAADIEIMSVDNYDLAQWIVDNLNFDQVILEMYNPDDGPNAGWVHVSYKNEEDNRNQPLTIYKGGKAVYGLHKE